MISWVVRDIVKFARYELFSITERIESIRSKMDAETSYHENVLLELFKSAVESVQPYKIIKQQVELRGRHLLVRGQKYELTKPIRVIGFGKAVAGMAIALEETLANDLQGGIVSVPYGLSESSLKVPENSKIDYFEGAYNNLPDENALNTAVKIKKFVENLDENDFVVVLISGGGSALLPLPKGNISLPEKLELIKKLGNAGANIVEMNCIRKEISELKGGGLAKICYPAKVITLILSDVIGDPLDIIASGPTCVNQDNTEKAIDILKKYSLYETLPKSMINVIEENLNTHNDHDSIKKGKFVHVDNFIIGNNEIAAKAVLKKSNDMDFQSLILSTRISGDVEDVCNIYVKIATLFTDYQKRKFGNEKLVMEILQLAPELLLFNENILVEKISQFDQNKPICLILSGEPTVVVNGDGLGGRNQQLALSFSTEISHLTGIVFLSCGTDGIDGPTDAAGAIGFPNLVKDSLAENLHPNVFLSNNDCYNFYSRFKSGRYLVKVGHTGTNVMDIHIILTGI